jgi:hypothetical protein
MKSTRIPVCLVLGVALGFVTILGCLGCETDYQVTTSVNSGLGLPERLQAAMGIDTDPTVPDRAWAWCVTRNGVATRELPARWAVGFGELGSTIVYSDEDTGLVHVWHPGGSSPDEIIKVDAPAGGRIARDNVALSPDEQLAALVRLESPEGSPDALRTRGYLIDPESGRVDSWAWLESVRSGQWVTTLVWAKTSDFIYVSFGQPGAGVGERSYRYDPFTGDSLELTGLGTVFDVGLQGQVVGLANGPASTIVLPGPIEEGGQSLVLWQDGEMVPLPRDERFVAWDHAWISDDGKTIVFSGSTPYQNSVRSCLEVLKLSEGGWEVSWLYIPDDSLDLVPGVAFEPNSGVFWFQGGLPAAPPRGLVSEIQLYELDTDTNQVLPSMRLPGASGDFSTARSIAGTECRGGT